MVIDPSRCFPWLAKSSSHTIGARKYHVLPILSSSKYGSQQQNNPFFLIFVAFMLWEGKTHMPQLPSTPLINPGHSWPDSEPQNNKLYKNTLSFSPYIDTD